jgi:hypothetical protein
MSMSEPGYLPIVLLAELGGNRVTADDNLDLKEDAQSVTQILTNPSGRHFFFEIAVGRHDKADIDFGRLVIADTFKFLFVQRT